jgi:gluconolactonase
VNIPLQYDGYNNLEGPVWYEGALYYSNIGNKVDPATGQELSNQTTIWKLQPGAEPEVWLDDSLAGTNGMALDQKGRLVTARHLDGSISIINWQSKTITALASQFNGKRFNSPNDLTISSDGTIYFTDPDWNVPNTVDRKTTIGSQAIYRITARGDIARTRVTDLVHDLADKPNGIMLSIDESDLLVAGLRGLWKFDIEIDGVTNPSRLLDTPIDGLGKDCAGNIYITTSRNASEDGISQRVVILDKDYVEVGDIAVPGIQIVTNLAFGGEQRKTLFITSLTVPDGPDGKPRYCGDNPCYPASIFSLQLNVPGFPH